MKIRTKLAVLIAGSIFLATLATAAGFIQLQRKALRQSENEKKRLLLESVRQSARESLLAQDPLMLLDALATLVQQREEIHHARVRVGDKFEDVGGAAPPSPPGGVREELLEVSVGDSKVAVVVEFSAEVLDKRLRDTLEAMTRNVLRVGGVVLAAGLLFSFPLGRMMTGRIVEIEEALYQIGQGKLGQEVPAQGSDEVARLARGVNRMSSQLKELEQMKRTFVASVTHELRSPLGAIEAYVKEMLGRGGSLTEEDKSNLSRIHKNVVRLEHFVTSLLELSKIERGKLDFHPQRGSLTGIVEDTALFFEPKAREAGMSLVFASAPGMPSTVFDPDLISQVVTNLVSNAIKFTRKGGKIRVTAQPKQGGIEVAVEDSGVGIPEEALARVFQPFERIKNPLRSTGAGLGLSICKSIVEMHGGTLGVTSTVGKGSRFNFILPHKPPTPI